MQYYILQHPGHNRVYYNASDVMALAELRIASLKLSVKTEQIKVKHLKKVRYLSFKTENELSEADIEIISRLSFVFALFQSNSEFENELLSPLELTDYQYIDSKISTLQKYKGKTNELFTKMMINVGLLSSDFNYSDQISLLDPVSGRGTTLFEAAIYGFNAYGIELEPKSVHESTVFFKKYLEKERIKHSNQKQQVSGKSKAEAVWLTSFSYAKRKEDFKEPSLTKQLGVVGGPSQDAHQYFKQASFNLIIGDLPYGIVHGNTAENKRKQNLTRNPKELLEACLPSWYKVLKPGGVIVMAWNSFLVSRMQLSKVFEANKLEVLNSAPYDDFEHMVDQSIKRDIIVAKKMI